MPSYSLVLYMHFSTDLSIHFINFLKNLYKGTVNGSKIVNNQFRSLTSILFNLYLDEMVILWKRQALLGVIIGESSFVCYWQGHPKRKWTLFKWTAVSLFKFHKTALSFNGRLLRKTKIPAFTGIEPVQSDCLG